MSGERHPPPERKTSLSSLVQSTVGAACLGTASLEPLREAQQTTSSSSSSPAGRRLHFNAKTSAGSEASRHEAAAIDKLESTVSMPDDSS